VRSAVTTAWRAGDIAKAVSPRAWFSIGSPEHRSTRRFSCASSRAARRDIRAIAEEYVLPFVDELGTLVWVPVDVRDMRLKDRVRSLFVADYLNLAADYQTALAICSRCGDVVFDEHVRRTGMCGALADQIPPSNDASRPYRRDGTYNE
jgi:hypothetical protein